METLPIWTIWFAVSAILIISEIFTGTFFLLCFGIAAGASAIAATAEVSIVGQWAVFAVISSVSVAFSRKLFLSVSTEPEQKAGVDRLVGKKGVVTESIETATDDGRVSVMGDCWRASSHGQPLEEGTRVMVVGVEGTKLIVEEVE